MAGGQGAFALLISTSATTLNVAVDENPTPERNHPSEEMVAFVSFATPSTFPLCEIDDLTCLT
eukprot:CAMPEP_0194256168 /NCGR_PEP_ID=MMETSP0158-20130606/36158_1 /TAXON_ID=33649 /ORGANISM="Thalassionema nitzschioides, Strain L26-B" /LENGTH=62 /DNA_ID=CAMNT_0038994775 /DNA_START=96 /DNA_END=284 /DNA_ORIENTATION=+